MTHGSRWVGIDLHRRRSKIAVVDEQGELTLSRRIINDRQTLLQLLAGVEGETHVALEATSAGNGWPSCSRTRAMTPARVGVARARVGSRPARPARGSCRPW